MAKAELGLRARDSEAASERGGRPLQDAEATFAINQKF